MGLNPVFMRILIVDDHEIVRKGIRTLLSAERYVVLGEAADGEEAVEKAEELKPDVILMDVSMDTANRCAGGIDNEDFRSATCTPPLVAPT